MHPLPSWWPAPNTDAPPQLAELVGASSSGKLTLALLWIAALPSDGPLAVVDPSGHLHPPSIAACGIDVQRLAVVHPPHAQDLPRVVLELTRSDGFDAILACLDARTTISMAGASQLRNFMGSAHTTVLFLRTAPDAYNPTAAIPMADTRVQITSHKWLWRDGELSGLQVHVRTERSRHELSGDEHVLTMRLHRRGLHGPHPDHVFVDTALRTRGHHTFAATSS